MTPSKEIDAILCIGANCGNREANVKVALNWLSGILRDFRQSHIYATPDCNGGQREYLNAVCAGKSILDADQLEKLCKEYELLCGRDSTARKAGDVPLDIDIVVVNGCVVREKDYGCEFFQIGRREIAVVRDEASPWCDEGSAPRTDAGLRLVR